jgi:chromosome partitioning protein
MAVIAFINQKGGCGKSTSAVHCVYWLAVKKKRTALLVDADAQQSSSVWLKGMEIVSIPFQVLQSPDDLLEKLPHLKEQYDHVIVDGPASLAETTRAVLFRADLAIVPCQPTGVDLRSASDAIRLIQQAQSVRGGPPQAALFLSRAIRGTKLKQEALELLNKLQTPRSTPTPEGSCQKTLLKTVIHQRQSIADTSGQLSTVWDLSGAAAVSSAKDYASLFKEILGLLP